MRRQNRMKDSDKDRGRIKPTAVFSMAGALVSAAILLSGLSLIGSESSQSAIAQEQSTTGGTSGGGSSSSTASNTTAVTGGGAAQGENATSTTGGANQSTSEIRMSLEQARTALQNNDTQSAMTFLDKALGSMGTGGTEGNMTSSSASSGGNSTTSGGSEGVSVGGTSAADDYDETPDAGG